MELNFKQQLERQLLYSERRRVIILIYIFSFGILYRVMELFFSDQVIQTGLNEITMLWIFPFSILSFEIFSLLVINSRLKSAKAGIPYVRQFFNAVIEVTLPSVIILFVSSRVPSYDFSQSAGVYIYFIFIILSTLRLNFFISLCIGFLSAIFYLLLAFFREAPFIGEDVVKAVVIFLSGLAAGLVARQIRKAIDVSLKETEKRNRVIGLFGQQISKEIAEKMLEADGKIESKRMNVAVMFIDIRDFTKFVAGKNPEEIVQYQNAFFDIVINVVVKHCGIVNQFLGDGCMVTFGAPVEMNNPSMNAVDASIQILHELNDAIRAGSISSTRIGIGIHTGDVVTGNIGTATRQQYSITGNVVIMAARIEQLNKKFNSQVLISEEVADKIRHRYSPVVSLGEENLKGFEPSCKIYKVA
jgi:adenylate cyclase